MIESSFSDIWERRSIGRTVTIKNALLFFTGVQSVYSCWVRDITRVGAGIRLEKVNILPMDLLLSFDGFETAKICRLIWRDGDYVGVTFEGDWALKRSACHHQAN